MENLVYRTVEKKNNRFPDWLNEYRNQSGAYVFRDKNTKQILYVGESHTGRIAATIKRHFWTWDDTEDRKHFVFNPLDVELAIRVTPQKSAKGAQDNLIRRLLPKFNTQAIPADLLSEREPPPVVDLIEW